MKHEKCLGYSNPTSRNALFFLSLSVVLSPKKSLFLVVVRSRGIHEPRPSVDESFSFSHESGIIGNIKVFLLVLLLLFVD